MFLERIENGNTTTIYLQILIPDCFLYMTIRASKDIESLMPKSYDFFRIFKKYPQEQNA